MAAPNWTLLTDGSGHKDGYGGWASLAISAKGDWIDRSAAIKGTTTESAEFLGLLNGLGSIVDFYVSEYSAKSAYMRLEASRPIVHWITDRESLALAVWRGPDGKPIYARRSTPELWAMFSYYEPLFRIVPIFTTREANAMHDRVDKAASEMRILIKEYYMASEDT